jgi:hypothetical protein
MRGLGNGGMGATGVENDARSALAGTSDCAFKSSMIRSIGMPEFLQLGAPQKCSATTTCASASRTGDP